MHFEVAAKVRTAEKKAKYRQFEEGSRNISIPFIMEATGGFSSSAVKVINKLMAYYEEKGKWTEQLERHTLMAEISSVQIKLSATQRR